jgi:hypothetical protein
MIMSLIRWRGGEIHGGSAAHRVVPQPDRRHGLRDLTRGKLGQGREDEFGLSDLLAGVSYA